MTIVLDASAAADIWQLAPRERPGRRITMVI
jgi:hypothetical protein